jgi:ribosome-interacting GTPase 1
MSLTDATKLIKRDKKDKGQTKALGALKKKLASHKKTLEKQLKDADRGLDKINKHLGR